MILSGLLLENKIHCILQGHTYVNEIQTIAQLCFPNARFQLQCVEAQETETQAAPVPNAEGWAVVSRLRERQAVGAVFYKGVLQGTHTLPVPAADETNPINVSTHAPVNPYLKRTLMLALFHALKAVFDMHTPWGALTGIRPSKLVRMWLSEGKSETDIAAELQHIYQCRLDKIQLALAVANAENRVAEALDLCNPKTAGIYIGIPYCPSRCLYCSFITAPTAGEPVLAAYLQALERECALLAQAMQGIKCTALYIGGGTPTVFGEKQLDTLLAMVARYFAPQALQMEYTVEAGRPDSITPEKLKHLKTYGVNRISINPQTLNDATLQRIGRAHTAEMFYQAFAMARAAGFGNINTDVVLGLPGEEPADVRNTMEGLARLCPESITVHTLAVKRASRLNEHLEDYRLVGADAMETMLDISRTVCAVMGLRPYYMYRQKNMLGNFENVGYCLPGYESAYNVGMMADLQTIYGAGAGAVTKRVDGSRIVRTFNVKNPAIYVQKYTSTTESG